MLAEHPEQSRGQQVRCPICGSAMVVGAANQTFQPGPSMAASPGANPAFGQPAPKKPINLVLIILAIVGGGGLLLCCVIGAVVSMAIPSLQRAQPQMRQQRPPMARPPMPPGAASNPHTTMIGQLRKQLAETQQRKVEHAERMQRTGSAGPNPFERQETSLQEHIERLEQSSQEWEQRQAPK